MFMKYDCIVQVKNEANAKNAYKFGILEYDPAKHGEMLYLVTCPFTDNITGRTFAKGSLLAMNDTKGAYMQRHKGFLTFVNQARLASLKGDQKLSDSRRIYKIPPENAKDQIFFPIEFFVYKIVKDWEEADKKISEYNALQQEFATMSNELERYKREKQLFELEKKLEEMTASLDKAKSKTKEKS